jgi:hypothetical protein
MTHREAARVLDHFAGQASDAGGFDAKAPRFCRALSRALVETPGGHDKCVP